MMPVGNFTYEQFKPKMTTKEFEQFRDLVYSQTHIFCVETQKPLLERKIRFRLEALNLSSFREYYKLLVNHREGKQELVRLIDLIAVHETSFFRIRGHFTGLAKRVFPDLINQLYARGIPIEIWSAGCSTGEEPYSIVIVFLEMLLHQGLCASETRELRIIATDISPFVIEKAREGVYSQKQVRNVQQPLLDKYFSCYDHRYCMSTRVKKFVDFTVFNLAHLETISERKFDVIFCRNVLIYFDRRAQIKLLKGLINSLSKRGYLFLGDVESIYPFPEAVKKLDLIELGNAIIYQKRGV